MSIKDMPHVTVEQVLELRAAAIKMEKQIADIKEAWNGVQGDISTLFGIPACFGLHKAIANEPEALECKHDDQVANLTTALNDLLEKAKLCKECNQVFNSLSEAIKQAEKVMEGKV